MKKAIIIGATSGIGHSLAKLFAAHGYKTGITGRRQHLLEELKAHYPEVFVYKVLDIKDTATTARILDNLAAELGGLDLLVISSGTGHENPQLDFAPEKDTAETNVDGFTSVAVWAWRYFEKQGYGHIAAITSIAGLRGNKDAPAYNATKAYQISYLEGLQQKAVKNNKNIFVTDLRPGFVNTEMAKGDGMFWVAPVEKAAKQMFRAIQKRKKVAYVTRRWRIIGLLLQIIPKRLYMKM